MIHILNPWPWYVSGPLIALVMALLLYFGKTFGVSSNFRTMCSILGGGKVASFFKFDWKLQIWNLIVILGGVIGGYIAVTYLSNHDPINLNPKTVEDLQLLGFNNAGNLLVPLEMFGIEAISTPKGLLLLVIGGFLVGFGTRYAGGCTSGHAITGLSSLQRPSLIAVIGFFIGGLVMVHLIFPFIF
ncbi:MAG: YeeE/YedE family protein [Aestuariibaculum sp.]